MTVSELIDFLKTQPQHLPVAFCSMSEQILLDSEKIHVEELCHAREDGWVANRRPDKPHRTYLVFPGN